MVSVTKVSQLEISQKHAQMSNK